MRSDAGDAAARAWATRRKARGGQLVTQFLENVSRDLLSEYQDIIRDFVRQRHGVYVLYRRGKPYYLGLAKNLRNRLRTHLKDRHGDSWDRFSVWLTIRDEHIKELETLMLRIVKPPGNKVGGKFVRAENLRVRLKREILKRQRSQLDDLVGLGHVPVKSKRATTRKPADTDAVLYPYVKRLGKRFEIRASYKGRTIKGHVRLDGVISVRGIKYTSPSLAAAGAIKKPTMNGWKFWKYERAPGDWVLLTEMRK